MALVKSLRPGVGNWVDGERFFNRDAELGLFVEHLQNGESISLVAQRRIGKTSLMREASRRLGDRALSIHVDLEKCQTPEDALVELTLAMRPHAGLWARTIEIVSSVAKSAAEQLETLKLYELSVSLRGEVTAKDWRQKGDAIFAALAQAAEQQKKVVVLFLDEVPILVSRLLKGSDGDITPERRAQTDLFMSWLRDNALRHRGKVSLVVTGSVGLEPLLGQAGLNGTLNAYRSFEIKPWPAATAMHCLLALAAHHQLPLPQAAAKRMVERLGSPIPHHVQMFYDHVRTAYIVGEQEGEITAELVDAVYQDTMTGLRGHPELSHMEERLRIVLSTDQFTIALELLTEAAVAGGLAAGTALKICSSSESEDPRRTLNNIIAILLHDGYLVEAENGFRFASLLLQDWWRRRFGQGYQVVGEVR
jgi:hypothetical protein